MVAALSEVTAAPENTEEKELSLEDRVMQEVLEEWTPRPKLADEDERFRVFRKGERVDRVYSPARPQGGEGRARVKGWHPQTEP